jgi:hypothetical protein
LECNWLAPLTSACADRRIKKGTDCPSLVCSSREVETFNFQSSFVWEKEEKEAREKVKAKTEAKVYWVIIFIIRLCSPGKDGILNIN